ncbi:hypothetical protein BDM02DRAFT_3113617, partial [Thelephora ganbajun]
MRSDNHENAEGERPPHLRHVHPPKQQSVSRITSVFYDLLITNRPTVKVTS